MRKLTEQEAIHILNVLFTGWQFMEGLDKISETSLYRHTLKLRVKQLMPEVERLVDGLEDFFRVDVQAMNNLMDHRRELLGRLMDFRPEVQAGLNELIAVYMAAPEETLVKLGVVIRASGG